MVVSVSAGVRCGDLPSGAMGDIEGSYRVLQTPGTRLGAQFNAGISTLEPGQSLSGGVPSSRQRSHGRGLQIRVQGLDESQEFFDIDVSSCSSISLCSDGWASAQPRERPGCVLLGL